MGRDEKLRGALRSTSACRRPPIALYLEWVMWEHPHHGVPGGDRPVSLRSLETGAERGSSRPGLPEPAQVPGTRKPASCKAGPVRSLGRVSPQICVGIDVAKAHLDIALRPTGTRWTVANEEAGIADLVTQ